MGPMSGRGRGLLGRGDQGKKAVFRNREQDLQDPDYRRGYKWVSSAINSTLATMAGSVTSSCSSTVTRMVLQATLLFIGNVCQNNI